MLDSAVYNLEEKNLLKLYQYFFCRSRPEFQQTKNGITKSSTLLQNLYTQKVC